MPNLNDAFPQDITTSSNTFSHQNNTNEQDVLVFTNLANNIEVSFDMINLTQDTTVRIYEKVDGSNYRIITEAVYPTDFDTNADAITMELRGKNVDTKITFQSAVGEGSAKNVPWARTEIERL